MHVVSKAVQRENTTTHELMHVAPSLANFSPTLQPNVRPNVHHAKCLNFRQFRVEANGRMMSWTNRHPQEKESIPPWPEYQDGDNTFSMRPEMVDFLNTFFKRQYTVFCETPRDAQHIMFIRRENGLGNSIQGSTSYLMMAALKGWAVVLVGWFDGLNVVFDTPLAEYTPNSLTRQGLLSSEARNAVTCSRKSHHLQCFDISGDDQWMWCNRIEDHFKKRLNHIPGCCGSQLPLLLRNRHYGSELLRIFGEDEMAPPLYRVFFRPSWKSVMSKRKPSSRKVVAAQVRAFNRGEEGHLVQAMSACLKMIVSRQGFGDSSIYVASQNVRLIRSLEHRLGRHVSFNKPPEGENHGTKDWILAVQDMWDMATADALVLTAWSTFGSTAAAWSRRVPWELEGSMNQLTGRCSRVISAEPCCMRNWGPVPNSCPGRRPLFNPPKVLIRKCGFDHGAAGAAKWKGVAATEGSPTSSANELSDSGCEAMQQFRVEADGRVLVWTSKTKPREHIPAWTKDVDRGWSLRTEAVAFLNAFFEEQYKILCRQAPDQQKIMFVQRESGLGNFGNTLQAMVSFLVMGALMGRAVVLVGWSADFGKAFDSPLAEYTEQRLQELELLSPEALAAMRCEESVNASCFAVSGNDRYMWCDSLEEHFPRRFNLVAACCTNYLPLLLRNYRYGPQLQQAFGIDGLATALYRILIRPSLSNVIAWGKRGAGEKVVAVHLRVFNPSKQEQVLRAMTACVQSVIAMPEFVGSRLSIEAPSLELSRKLEKMLNTSRSVSHTSPPQIELHGPPSWIESLRVIWSLVLADALILTPWSPVGTTATALAGSQPWELEGTREQMTGRCRRVTSSEPCCMRNWGPEPTSCTKTPPLRLPVGLDRPCGFDDGKFGSASWVGVSTPLSDMSASEGSLLP
eukprot:TRINITY_DN9004_c0_g1_i1.p1 TRINITY_DN9004_c0_g1~~TRINITY_DN9004_c0_g1_i1.p1  ORF type:complete len:1021 (+),score=132.49 TRINITY_DN9004_c0_g1_i1:342-3065(+)